MIYRTIVYCYGTFFLFTPFIIFLLSSIGVHIFLLMLSAPPKLKGLYVLLFFFQASLKIWMLYTLYFFFTVFLSMSIDLLLQFLLPIFPFWIYHQRLLNYVKSFQLSLITWIQWLGTIMYIFKYRTFTISCCPRLVNTLSKWSYELLGMVPPHPQVLDPQSDNHLVVPLHIPSGNTSLGIFLQVFHLPKSFASCQ